MRAMRGTWRERFNWSQAMVVGQVAEEVIPNTTTMTIPNTTPLVILGTMPVLSVAPGNVALSRTKVV
jgi:hypothetical protein